MRRGIQGRPRCGHFQFGEVHGELGLAGIEHPVSTEREVTVKRFHSLKGDARRVRYYLIALMAAWTGAVAISGTWNVVGIQRETIEAARITARAAHSKDVIYRRWNAAHGGV
jgi:uncharacterized iron-regulated membrane protein